MTCNIGYCLIYPACQQNFTQESRELEESRETVTCSVCVELFNDARILIKLSVITGDNLRWNVFFFF